MIRRRRGRHGLERCLESPDRLGARSGITEDRRSGIELERADARFRGGGGIRLGRRKAAERGSRAVETHGVTARELELAERTHRLDPGSPALTDRKSVV